MMKRLKILFFLVFLVAQIIGQIKVDLKKYGILEAKDATEIVYKALRDVNNKNAMLVFPKGIYHFYATNAYGKYHTITNHDNSYKCFAFPLIGSENIVIDGQGSEFIFHGVIIPFLVEQSSNITLRNFSIDWEEPFNIEGKVIESNEENQSMKIQFNSSSSLLLKGNQLGFTANGVKHFILGDCMIFDPKTNAVAYNADSYVLNTFNFPSVAQSEGHNCYTIKGKFKKMPAPIGMIYSFKGNYQQNRLAPAIHLKASKDVILEDINIYHAGGMGVIAEKTENIHLNKVDVKLREGSGRIVSTTADATHFCNCRGELIVENCLFENMLDDGTNIHGTYLKIDKIVDKHTVRAGVKHMQQYGYDFAKPGDKINFIHYETLLPIVSNIVKSVKIINDHLAEFKFEEPLPSGLKVNDALDNIDWYPQVVFRNNIVRNNRARSILISNRNRTIIENNTFSSMMSSILFEGDLNYWYESGAVNNVVIRNNTFDNNVYGGADGSVIWINPQMIKSSAENPYEKNIIIENNTFRTFDNSILRAKSVVGLVFKNNTIIPSKSYPQLFPEMPAIDLKECINSIVQGNRFEGDGKVQMIIDEKSIPSFKCDSNQSVFEKKVIPFTVQNNIK